MTAAAARDLRPGDLIFYRIAGRVRRNRVARVRRLARDEYEIVFCDGGSLLTNGETRIDIHSRLEDS